MNLRPLKTEADYELALSHIDKLFDARPDSPNGDILDILTTLVEDYEGKHYPVLPPDPIDAIVYHLESRGLSRNDLLPYIGSRARVAEILNRRRPLTVTMIRRLHDGLGISADILIQPYELMRSPVRTRSSGSTVAATR